MVKDDVMYENDLCVDDFRFQYVLDEKIIFSTLGLDMRWPLRVFNLKGLGVDQDAFVSDLAPTFQELAWDEYDVKREQIQFLYDCFPEHKERIKAFNEDFYTGKASTDGIRDLLVMLSLEKIKIYNQIKPYRRRTLARFYVEKLKRHAWRVSRVRAGSFSQSQGGDDYRAATRVFAEMSESVTKHPEFEKLLMRFGQMIEQIHRRPERLEITAHHVGIVARHGKFGDNSPEGIHQDGMHYIVSALVVERKHVRGGESHVYGDDKQTEYLRFTLKPGQGIFQTDIESPFWHVVSPIYLDPSGYEIGYRNIFGFDMKVL